MDLFDPSSHHIILVCYGLLFLAHAEESTTEYFDKYAEFVVLVCYAMLFFAHFIETF